MFKPVSAPAVLVCLAFVSGCGEPANILCEDEVRPCPSADAGAILGPEACSGQCVVSAPDEWANPVLLWAGPSGQEPPCPPNAPHISYDGYADPVDASLSCPTCSCDTPTGTCGLPDELTANAATCVSAPGAATRPFDPPASWDGSCTSASTIAAGDKCDGSLCVQSVTISPLSLTETGCAPVQHLPAKPPPPDPGSSSWNTSARACSGQASGPCTTPGTDCVPAAPAGFSTCIQQAGDRACPGAWPTKHVFYGDLADTRACSPCACDAPAGSLCTGLVSLYKDSACSVLLASEPVGSTGPECADIQPPGQAIGSTAMTMVAYQPGACAPSGGQPTGSVQPETPTTFCCQP